MLPQKPPSLQPAGLRGICVWVGRTGLGGERRGAGAGVSKGGGGWGGVGRAFMLTSEVPESFT